MPRILLRRPLRLPALGVAALAALALTGTASAEPAGSAATAVFGPVKVTGKSPVPGCTHGNSPGSINYPGAEVEPSVAVNPRNPANVVGFYQQDRWSDGGARVNAVSVTRDAGRTWRQVVPQGVAKCAGGPYERVSDPWVSFSPNGTVYAHTLGVGFDANGDQTISALAVHRSTDGGLTWGRPIIQQHDADPNFFNDKNTLTADPTDSRFAYAVWDRIDAARNGAPVMFTRTTNGGRTWEKTRLIYDPTAQGRATISNQITVLPNGDLVNVFFEYDTGVALLKAKPGMSMDERRAAVVQAAKAAQAPNEIRVIRSKDKGRTWSRPVTVGAINVAAVVDPDGKQPLRVADIVPDIAADAKSGQVYVVWADATYQTAGSAIVLSTSRNGGRTWSRPLEVSKTPDSAPQGNGQAFTQMVDVSSNGTVGVTYYDFRRNTPAAGALTDYWIVTCRARSCVNSASGWREQHVGGSFDVTQAPVARGYFLGDYMGLDHAGPAFVPMFAQSQNVPDNRQEMYIAAVLP